ncbi:MAG: PEGA domain-containing protein [Bacteroidales bacterium]|nr:PEGA domain-containing protein [Bacteroidales bacterium]
MNRIFLLIATAFLSLSLLAQNNESFLHVDDFKVDNKKVFVRPESVKNKTDNNGKPWAMIEIVAKGFDGALLKDLSVFSSSTLKIGYAGYNDEDNSYNLILSSDVKGSITIKYQGAMIEYQLPYTLIGNKVYTLSLAMRSANLTILATPPEAKIFIDGQEVGSKGYASVDLRLGEHVYSVECEDYFAEKNKIIQLNKNERIKVNLQPLFGYITVNSVPQGADVHVDGARVGVTPYLMKKIKRGQHNIEVQLNGYYSHAELVDIEVSEEKTLNIELVGYGNVTSAATITNLTLRLSQDSLYFNSEQGYDSIFVTTNNIDWNFNEAPRWLSLYRRNNILFVTCMKNTVHESREADIAVYTGDLTKNLHIYQDVGKAVLKSSLNKIVFESHEDTQIRILETNVFNWKLSTSDEWIEAFERSDTLIVTCQENRQPISRYGWVKITAFGQTMTVEIEQKSHVTKFNAPKESLVVEAEGGSMAIPIGVIGESWECVSNDPWIEVLRSGDVVLMACDPNESIERNGSFIMSTATKAYKINVIQKGVVNKPSEILIDTKPTWSRIYIDGKYKGRTPLKVAVDDSVHFVRNGRETRSYIFNSNLGTITFKPGLRYLQATASSETFGFRSGFIGVKHWGAYNHFQMNLGTWDFDPDLKKAPLYIYSLGPSFEIFPWMSIYAGVGVSVTNDTLGTFYDQVNDTLFRKTAHTSMGFGLEAEAGLMFYYKNIVLSGGIQMTNIGADNMKTDFSVGLGLYFNRYYTKRFGYCATKSREWWSLSYVFNPVRNGHGVMFSDLGKHSTRIYIKTMAEFPENNVYDMGLSLGLVLNTIPSYIDLMLGAGMQATLANNDFDAKGIQAEIGFKMNLWRFPLGVMMRFCELEKDTRYITVDFSVGFSFGEFLTNKKYKK